MSRWSRQTIPNSLNITDFLSSLLKLRNALNLDGQWSDWNAWGTCSVTCGNGNQTRTRLCNNPAPANGGANCSGSGLNSQSCNTQGCPISTSFIFCTLSYTFISINYKFLGSELLQERSII